MANIKDTEYLTLKCDEKSLRHIYVGNERTKLYHNEVIFERMVRDKFRWVQMHYPEIEEFHFGAFATRGEYCKTGNPSGEFGPNAWCRVKLKNGLMTPWIYVFSYDSAAFCARIGLQSCMHGFRHNAAFRATVLGAIGDKAEQFEVVQDIRKGITDRLKSNGK